MNKVVVLTICAVAAARMMAADHIRDQSPVAMKVTSACDLNTCKLQLEIANVSRSDVRLYESMLPWKWYGMLLVAYENRPAGPALQPFLPTDDPDATAITLAPGGKLTGEIDLNRRFPSLRTVLGKFDVALFWSYSPRGPGLPASGNSNVGGVVLSSHTSKRSFGGGAHIGFPVQRRCRSIVGYDSFRWYRAVRGRDT